MKKLSKGDVFKIATSVIRNPDELTIKHTVIKDDSIFVDASVSFYGPEVKELEVLFTDSKIPIGVTQVAGLRKLTREWTKFTELMQHLNAHGHNKATQLGD